MDRAVNRTNVFTIDCIGWTFPHSDSNLPQRPHFDNPSPQDHSSCHLFPPFFYQLGFSVQHNPNKPAQNPITTLLPTRRFSSLDSCHYQYCFDWQYTWAPLSAMWEKPGVLEINKGTSLLFPAHPWCNYQPISYVSDTSRFLACYFRALCFNHLFTYLAFLEIDSCTRNSANIQRVNKLNSTEASTTHI